MKQLSFIPGLFLNKKRKAPLLSDAISNGINDVFQEMGYRKIARINPLNMRFSPVTNNDQVDEIASCFADNFVKKIYELQNEKSYSAYVKSLSEIFQWAHEFYIEYNHKIKDWESFERSSDNIFKAKTREDFQIAWGNERIMQLSDQCSKDESHKMLNIESFSVNNINQEELVKGDLSPDKLTLKWVSK